MAAPTRKLIKGRAKLSSVSNAILVLKAFSDGRGELGIGAPADRLHVVTSTVHGLASTLVGAGMLEQSANGQHRLGLAVFELGSLVSKKIDRNSSGIGWRKPLRCTGKGTAPIACRLPK